MSPYNLSSFIFFPLIKVTHSIVLFSVWKPQHNLKTIFNNVTLSPDNSLSCLPSSWGRGACQHPLKTWHVAGNELLLCAVSSSVWWALITADLHTAFQFCGQPAALAYLFSKASHLRSSIEFHLKHCILRTISSCIMYSSNQNVPTDLLLLNTKKEQKIEVCLPWRLRRTQPPTTKNKDHLPE